GARQQRRRVTDANAPLAIGKKAGIPISCGQAVGRAAQRAWAGCTQPATCNRADGDVKFFIKKRRGRQVAAWPRRPLSLYSCQNAGRGYDRTSPRSRARRTIQI